MEVWFAGKIIEVLLILQQAMAMIAGGFTASDFDLETTSQVAVHGMRWANLLQNGKKLNSWLPDECIHGNAISKAILDTPETLPYSRCVYFLLSCSL